MANRITDNDKSVERLRWQCRRGMLELDIILQRFLNNDYQRLNDQEKLSFSKLLEDADVNLLAYFNQTKKCPDHELNQIINKII